MALKQSISRGHFYLVPPLLAIRYSSQCFAMVDSKVTRKNSASFAGRILDYSLHMNCLSSFAYA